MPSSTATRRSCRGCSRGTRRVAPPRRVRYSRRSRRQRGNTSCCMDITPSTATGADRPGCHRGRPGFRVIKPTAVRGSHFSPTSTAAASYHGTCGSLRMPFSSMHSPKRARQKNRRFGRGTPIGPLQDNGGSTLTHALLPGSPAIDAGNPAAPGSDATACEATDQRGVRRPQDGDGVGGARCDIGAFERSRYLDNVRLGICTDLPTSPWCSTISSIAHHVW